MLKSKKVIALLLSVSMLATSLVACSTDDKTDDTKEPDNSVTDDKNTDDGKDQDVDTDKDDDATDEFTYPMSYDGEQISIWTNSFFELNSSVNSADDSPWHKQAEINTGLDLEWSFVPSGTEANTAYNLIISGSTFPTLIGNVPVKDCATLVDDGVLINITDYLEEYAPTYYSILNDDEYDYHRKSLTTDDGEIVAFGGWREETYGTVYQGMIIRNDLLIEQGLEIPETIADWENTMEVMYNEYGMTFGFDLAKTTPLLGSGFGAYATSIMTSYVDDGEVKIAQMQDEWKNYMVKMAEWYDKGYIDPDCLTIDDKTMQAKLMNGDCFAAPTTTSRLTNFNINAAEANNGFEWIGAPYAVVEGESSACYGHTSDIVRVIAVGVSTSATAEQIEAAMRFVDYFYTDEGEYFMNFGVEGEIHTVDADGNIVWDDIIFDSTELRSLYASGFNTCVGAQLTDLVQSIYDEKAISCVYLWSDTDAPDYFYPTSVSYTSDESYQRTNIYTATKTYIEETTIDYISGKLDPETHFDTFLQTLDDMGINTVIDIDQAAYDRFLAR